MFSNRINYMSILDKENEHNSPIKCVFLSDTNPVCFPSIQTAIIVRILFFNAFYLVMPNAAC